MDETLSRFQASLQRFVTLKDNDSCKETLIDLRNEIRDIHRYLYHNRRKQEKIISSVIETLETLKQVQLGPSYSKSIGSDQIKQVLLSQSNITENMMHVLSCKQDIPSRLEYKKLHERIEKLEETVEMLKKTNSAGGDNKTSKVILNDEDKVTPTEGI